MERATPARNTSGHSAWPELMAAAQAGDRRSYEKLLRDCVPHLRRVVRRTGVKPDSVDDVVQDVLMTVHRARQTYDPGRSFASWLSAIAQRRAIDHLRHRGRQDRREVSDDLSYASYPDGAATPEGMLDIEHRLRDVRGAVAGLSPGQREAVELLALRQRSLAEAASETGKTKGALKVNLHRALNTLRARFDGAE
jgi:RNA polymerase sigma-70 factor (ECF subfamily)